MFSSNNYEYDLKNQTLSSENFDREYQILKEKIAKNDQN